MTSVFHGTLYLIFYWLLFLSLSLLCDYLATIEGRFFVGVFFVYLQAKEHNDTDKTGIFPVEEQTIWQ